MFEFSVAKKYLIPRRKQLSVSLIALLSIFVISLVVWLVLVFLSVMEGIERSWLDKLTSLNAHLRITPTEHYYSSYYYQIDALSSNSHYHSKTIGQKYRSQQTDPYLPAEDQELPSSFPKPDRMMNGMLKDPVKVAFHILDDFSANHAGFVFQDYEMSGAMLRLQLIRPEAFSSPFQLNEHQNFLTQVSYVTSFPDKNPHLNSLLLPPTNEDVNHLFYLAFKQNKQVLPSFLRGITEHIHVKQIEPISPTWKLSSKALPENVTFRAWLPKEEAKRTTLFIPLSKHQSGKETLSFSELIEGEVVKRKGNLTFRSLNEHHHLPLSDHFDIQVVGKTLFSGHLISDQPGQVRQLKDLKFQIKFSLQDQAIETVLPWENLQIASVEAKTEFATTPSWLPPWPHLIANRSSPSLLSPHGGDQGIILAKSFQEHGVRIGDKGYLSYMANSASSLQEQRLPIYVAGFYDPGIMAIGTKSILAPYPLLRSLNNSNFFYSFDRTLSNGIQIWCKNASEATNIKQELTLAFQKANIADYWKIISFHDYEFAKDLLQQFQSDKYLFTLVGVIILLVACCNIVSFLILLVNDKKKEIAILQALGASPKSIACIFGSCGIFVGVISSGIGVFTAMLTLRYLEKIVNLLSFVQGHELFNAMFYGKALPNSLSTEALLFVLISTPILSLCAGLIPAIKACRLHPSPILRAE